MTWPSKRHPRKPIRDCGAGRPASNRGLGLLPVIVRPFPSWTVLELSSQPDERFHDRIENQSSLLRRSDGGVPIRAALAETCPLVHQMYRGAVHQIHPDEFRLGHADFPDRLLHLDTGRSEVQIDGGFQLAGVRHAA